MWQNFVRSDWQQELETFRGRPLVIPVDAFPTARGDARPTEPARYRKGEIVVLMLET
jgi:hypothetical protein